MGARKYQWYTNTWHCCLVLCKKLVELVSPVVDGLFLMGKEKNCKGEKVNESLFMFRVRNIVV